MSIKCGARFRPCIDIHKGKVKQIVGSTLQDLKEGGSSLVTNFESDKSAAEYASLYKEDGLTGGHVIMLGADPLSKSAATEALHAYPGGLQVGGGINADNALSYIEEGASHVIVTSYVFNNGQMDLQRLKYLVRIVGKQRLVLDLSCRKKGHSQKMSLALAYSYFQRLFLQLLARLMQCSWLGECRARYRRSAYFIQVSQSSVQLVSAILVTLIVLGILASLVA